VLGPERSFHPGCSVRSRRCSTRAASRARAISSILPVDQGVEHSAAASFAEIPLYFDPENIVKLAIEGGCNAVASTLGVLGSRRAEVRAQDPVHASRSTTTSSSTYPNKFDQIMFGKVDQCFADMGAVGVGATIYFGSDRVDPPDCQEVSRRRSSTRTSSDCCTVLWCYLRNRGFKKDNATTTPRPT
jgi:class I fructose-bisphosphate aldolase